MLNALVLSAMASSALAVTGKLGDAPVVNNNPTDVSYEAKFSGAGGITGQLVFAAPSNGTGVQVTVDIEGLPSSGGPFLYHIHQLRVPANGSCLATLAHLDPYERGDTIPADPSAPQTDQVGDLSGKHGTIPNGEKSFHAQYVDDYLALTDSNPAFIGNHSVVIHFNNTTRIACTNLEKKSGSSNSTGNHTSGSPTSVETGSENSASSIGLSSFAVGFSVAAGVAYLM